MTLCVCFHIAAVGAPTTLPTAAINSLVLTLKILEMLIRRCVWIITHNLAQWYSPEEETESSLNLRVEDRAFWLELGDK